MNIDSSAVRLLGAADPPAAIAERAGAASPFLIVCDHAGREIPSTLGRLGAPRAAFDRHIAWDIGAGALSLALGGLLGACVIRQTYSRLVIDCNRAPDRADAIVEVSDGTPIPGNIALSLQQRAARVTEVHAPYHNRIAQELDDRSARGLATVLVAIHSFTPEMNGLRRPWHVGFLHLGDSPFSSAMLESLRSESDLVVGDNEPYAMDGIDYTVPRHAIGRGLEYVEIEIRQDLVAGGRGQAKMAERLQRHLTAVAAELDA